MPSMVVTLDVSRLSGWLNVEASCHKSKGGNTNWGEMRGVGRAREGRRRGRVQATCCGERTPNMPYMVVTLDVSRFSGWLNDDARCQVEQGACRFNAGCEVRAGRKEGVEWWHKQYACKGKGPKGKWELVGRAWSARRTLCAWL